MANSHKISGSALIALKEALTNIYWIKNDLKMFVNHTINNKSFVSTLDMTKYKREIANDIVNRMSNRLDIYEEDLLLLKDILKYDNENRCLYPLDHLDYLEDLCYMYYENRKNKKDFEFSPILIDFLKPYNDEYCCIEDPKKLYKLVYYANSSFYDYTDDDDDTEEEDETKKK